MQAIGSANGLSLALLISATHAPGRVSIPVPRNQVIFSYFKHVTGVAATDGNSSTVDKLQILNSLLDRLAGMKKAPLAPLESAGTLSPERIDALLEQYGSEAHALAVRSGPYVPSLGLPPGSLISLAA